MGKEKAPAFQCYPAELLNDEAVKLMDNREFGVYWKLICHNWTEKTIPADTKKLAEIVKEPLQYMAKIWPKMSPKFRKKGDRLTHRRVERERRKQREFSRKQSGNALKLWNEKKRSHHKIERPPSKPSHSQKDATAMPAREEHSSSASSASSSLPAELKAASLHNGTAKAASAQAHGTNNGLSADLVADCVQKYGSELVKAVTAKFHEHEKEIEHPAAWFRDVCAKEAAKSAEDRNIAEHEARKRQEGAPPADPLVQNALNILSGKLSMNPKEAS